MKQIKSIGQRFALVGLMALAVACGGGKGGPDAKSAKEAKDPSKADAQVDAGAAQTYQGALTAFTAHDQKGDWNPAVCKSVADQFLAAAKEQKSKGTRDFPEAYYNAGLAYQRCGIDDQAKAQFNAAHELDKDFHRSRAQLALYKYKESGNLDATVQELDTIIRDAKFQNVEALVALASLQMVRGGSTGGPGCNDDLACSQLNLQRALALDDSFMPAFNQLALYYLEQARGDARKEESAELVVASRKKTRVNKQRLDLAALVASQAQKKNPNYAPIHNTTGLILVELENYNGAVKSFARARQLNPKLFEAQMNYAAVNLSFRGFGEAADAYRKALELRPNTYEAHIGLALALRGMISNENFAKNVAEAQKHLDAAKKLEPNRAEAFFNEAILFEEFRAKRAPDMNAQIKEFETAQRQYEAFISKAGGKSAYADAVKVSKERIQDINDTVTFMKESMEMEKQNKIEMERMKKEEEAAKKAEAEAKAAEEKEKAAAAKAEAKPADKPAADAAAKPAPAAK